MNDCTCGSALTKVIHGYPTADLFEQAEKGLVALGGCSPDNTSPTHLCQACGATYRLNRGIHQLARGFVAPPTSGSYWIVDGLLAGGPHPGGRDPATTARAVGALEDAGLRRIVDLTDERESIIGNVSLDYRPHLGTATATRFPITDFGVPSREQMTSILDHIDACLDEGVYVHCWGGIGRTGTVVGCWLIRHRYANPDTVLATLASLRRRDSDPAHRRSPETPDQEEFVRSWRPGD